MEFRIADTFTAILAKLTGDEQKAVMTRTACCCATSVTTTPPTTGQGGGSSKLIQRPARFNSLKFEMVQEIIIPRYVEVRKAHQHPRRASAACGRTRLQRLNSAGPGDSDVLS